MIAVRSLVPWVVPAAGLGFWQAGGMTGLIPADVLPPPSAVIEAGWRLAASGDLLRNVEVSACRAGIGFALGGGLGFACGLLNGLCKTSERVLDTSLQMIRTIPHLALIPLVILWFGIGEEAKLFLISIGTFFPIYLNTMQGVRSVDPQLIEMGKAYRMSRLQLIRVVLLPGALPSIFVGLRYAMGVTWLTLIVAETISATSGIGYMAMNAREFMLVDVVVFSLLLYALLGKLTDSVARLLEQVCLSWHPAYRTN